MEQAISPDLGARLRQARLRQGSTLAQVGARIGVAPKSLRALEWGRPDLLRDESEARKLVRLYSEHLELGPEADPGENNARPTENGARVSPQPAERPRRKRRFLDRDLAPFLVVFAPALVAVALIMLIDSLHGSSRRAQASPARSARPPAARAPQPAAPTVTPGPAVVGVSKLQPAPRQARRASTLPSPPTTASVAKLAVTAPRGDSWLLVRAGSASGEILFGGILRRGKSIAVARPRLWVRIGAASNLDLRVNGSRPPLDLYGTVELVVGPRGIRKVPLSP